MNTLLVLICLGGAIYIGSLMVRFDRFLIKNDLQDNAQEGREQK